MDEPPLALWPTPRLLERRAGRCELGAGVAFTARGGASLDTPALRRLEGELALAGIARIQRGATRTGGGPERGAAIAPVPFEFALEGGLIEGPEGYCATIDGRGARCVAADRAGLDHAACTLADLVRARAGLAPLALPALEIRDRPAFARRGVLLDVARARVPRMDFLFELVDLLASWKLNELQLYMERSFAYAGLEPVGQAEDLFTAQELRALDEHCRERNIALVPNQQSFGHMHAWLRHAPHRALAECPEGVLHPESLEKEPFSLCPTDPASLDFLARLYDELLPCFGAGEVNVGCDETFDLGLGRSAVACRERGLGRVYLDFLHGIHGLVGARGRRMQFWADILLAHPELAPELPRDVVPLLWGYEADHPFEGQCATLAASGLTFYVCPGTSTWQSLGGRTDNALANLRSAARYGAASGARGYLVCDWGDLGHLQPPATQLFPLFFAAGAAWNPLAAELDDRRIGELLDRHVFRSQRAGLGRAVLELGRIGAASGARARNASPLSLLLTSPEQGFPPQGIEGLTRPGLERARAAFASVAKAIDGAALAPVPGRCGVPRLDGPAVLEELRWAADAQEFSIELASARFDAGSDVALTELPPHVRAALRERLAALILEHGRLWARTSRPGGLRRSQAWLARIAELLGTRGR